MAWRHCLHARRARRGRHRTAQQPLAGPVTRASVAARQGSLRHSRAPTAPSARLDTRARCSLRRHSGARWEVTRLQVQLCVLLHRPARLRLRHRHLKRLQSPARGRSPAQGRVLLLPRSRAVLTLQRLALPLSGLPRRPVSRRLSAVASPMCDRWRGPAACPRCYRPQTVRQACTPQASVRRGIARFSPAHGWCLPCLWAPLSPLVECSLCQHVASRTTTRSCMWEQAAPRGTALLAASWAAMMRRHPALPTRLLHQSHSL